MKIKTEVLFAIIGFVFGLLILFITPKFGVADEYAHYLRAKDISQGILYNNPKSTQNLHGASGYSPVMYAASGLGIAVTKNFNENIQFYTGRFFNLVVWILLIALAIHITPIFKWQFFLVSLFPMSIYQGMSLSADSFSNAFTFLFFAYMFKLIFNEKDFSYKKDISLLSLFSFTGALCKGAIFPIFLFPLVNIKNKMHKCFIFLFLIFVSIGTLWLWKMTGTGSIAKEVNFEYNLSYIYTFPLQFVFMIFKTIVISIKPWIYGCIGQMGWMGIAPHIVWTTFVLSLGVMFCVPENLLITKKHRITAFLVLLLYAIFTCLLLYFIYTPAWAATILGVQPRYFIQVIPLLFLIFARNIKPDRQTDKSKFIENMVIKSALLYMFLLLVYCSYIVI